MEPHFKIERAITCQKEATFTCSEEPQGRGKVRVRVGRGPEQPPLSGHGRILHSFFPSMTYTCLAYAFPSSIEPHAHTM